MIKTFCQTQLKGKVCWSIITIIGKINRGGVAIILIFLSHPLSAQVEQPRDGKMALTQDTHEDSAGMNSDTSRQGNRTNLDVFVDSSYVGSGNVNYGGTTRSKSDAFSLTLGLNAQIPLQDKWIAELGLGSENLFLNSVVGAPVPDQINTMRFSAGLGYRFSQKLTVAVMVSPLFYNLSDIQGNDLGFAGMVRTDYRVNPDLLLVFGVAFNPDSEYPVLPAAGLIWNIRRMNLVLNLMFPGPRLSYRVTPNLSLYAGGRFVGATFRTDSDQGDKIGLPRFNNALGTYRDFHLGGGVDYQIIRGLMISVEGGYSVGRQINYTRLDETVTFDPSPYIQASVKGRF
ncbi:MAG: porin family protein [Syntrophobacterales bacterium]|jgi:opacity protein-like surface antigen|nr:porin family protein [Syntrophobacterales bacterium]